MKTIACFATLLLAGQILGQDSHPGKPVYQKYCSQCHGENGDGQGYAEPYVLPKPRDFTSGVFKFRATGSEYLPLASDLERVVRDGISGTSMPSFAHIGENKIERVVAYIQIFYKDRMERDKEDGFWPPKEIEMQGEPKATAALIDQGKQLYLANGCGDCHGKDGKADGPSAPTLEDDSGVPIKPANLAAKWRFRGGDQVEDIYRAFSTGISGTPMPTYQDSLGDDERWALATYVYGLSPAAEPQPSPQVIAPLVEGALPESFDDPTWDGATEAFFPLTAQIIWEPVNTNPTVYGLRVKALHNGEDVTFLFTWDDPTFSLAGEEEEEEDDFFADEDQGGATLADGFAVQFPAGVPKTNERPYFVMGDSKSGVNLWRWTNSDAVVAVDSAAGDDDPWSKYHQEFAGTPMLSNQLAKGRDNLSELADGASLNGRVRYRNGVYQLIIKRALISEQPAEVQLAMGQFIPISFWAWDGHNEEEHAKGSLSSWYLLMLARPVDAAVYYKTVAAVVVMLLLQLLAIRSARKKAAASADESQDDPEPAMAQ